MKPAIKVLILSDAGERIFGEGPYRLLKAVEETGSLRQAALSMEMAYTKARKILSNSEKGFGVKLLIPTTGGVHGGGSVLSPQAKEILAKYELFRRKSREANELIYEEIFGASDQENRQ
ncbi:MAG: LysR family transcriptional regulator [Clostridia bacterium]|nr:LysR family transcriptional regulator [Clostridia bacterium]